MKSRLNQLQSTRAAFAIIILAQVFGISIIPRAAAEGGVPLWTNHLYRAHAVVLDPSENVLIAGNNEVGASIIKYSNAGVPLWTNLSGPLGSTLSASELAMHSSGNMFGVGISDNGNTLEYFALKYSVDGVPLWSHHYDSGQEDTWSNDFGFPRIALDSAGNVFVTGTITNSSGLELRIIKYSNDGVGIWTNRFPDAYATAIKIDSSDNVVVAGRGSAMRAYNAFLTFKYSNAGAPLWTNQLSSPGTDGTSAALDVAVDRSDNILVTGHLSRLGTNRRYVYATLKYSPSGTSLWTNVFDGGNLSASSRAVTVDNRDNVIVTGGVRGLAGGAMDYCTIKYSNDGMPRWTNRFGDSDGAFSVIADNNDNVLVSGYGGTVAYSPAGVVLWTDTSFITVGALALDSSGNVYAAGRFEELWSEGRYAIVKYSAIPVTQITLRILRHGSGYLIRGTSSPNISYRLQRSSTAIGPWSDISTNNASASGLVELHETEPLPGQAFYRAVQ